LRPLAGLAAQLDARGAHELSQRVPARDLPRELEPVVGHLNALLERLEHAFARQKQFSADVSHELRTPLAGVRSTLEVAVSRERAAPDYAQAMHDALEVVRQMQGLVENLLLLARLDAETVQVSREDVPLRALVDECFAPFSGRAHERALTFENRIAEGTRVQSDPAKLRIVVSNLLSNAVDYTQSGGAVWAEHGGGALVSVGDSGPPIPTEALESIFEPFVRLDAARAGSHEHSGVGLALVRSLCTVLGLTVRAENGTDRQVTFRVTEAR
jgi:signal transduction histidine kinase